MSRIDTKPTAIMLVLLCALATLPGAAANGNGRPACSDGLDNDGDALVDYPADPGCTSQNDRDEHNDADPTPPPAACSDGVDNDGDGRVDAMDLGCSGPTDESEAGPYVPPLPRFPLCGRHPFISVCPYGP